MGRKLALLIATQHYQDSALQQLTASTHDAEALAEVLGDPDIAGFEVATMVDEPHHVVGAAVGAFFRDLRHEDLGLLYFTGHGLKGEDGSLYLAMADTQHDNLLFTSLPAEQIDRAMSDCHSRRQVLILDCCYGGAFPSGRSTKADGTAHVLEQFRGRGRIVLTASDRLQYAFEGPRIRGQAPHSVFTRHLVEGLRDGSGDLDGDGDIAVDELYDFVFERVVGQVPAQRPRKLDNVEGRIVIARNINWALPPYVRNVLVSPLAAERLTAIEALIPLHRRGNSHVRAEVERELRKLTQDDSRAVSEAAIAGLQALLPGRRQAALRPPQVVPPSPGVGATASATTPAVPATPQVSERRGERTSPSTGLFVSTRRMFRNWPRRRGVAIGAVLITILGGAISFLLTDDNGSSSVPRPGVSDVDWAAARPYASLAGHDNDVSEVVFAPDGRTLASGGQDGRVWLWDVATREKVGAPLQGAEQHEVTTVAFSPDGRTLVGAGGTNGWVSFWNVASHELLNSVAAGGGTTFVESVAFSRDGKVLATGEWSDTLRLWDAVSRRESGKPLDAGANVEALAFSPDGKILATGGWFGTVGLWDMARRKELVRLPVGSDANIESLAFSPDGTLLASGGGDGMVRLWNVSERRQVDKAFSTHSESVSSVAFSPDGRAVATGEDDGSVCLWSVTRRTQLTCLKGHTDAVTSVAFSPDGKTLASGSADDTVRLWRTH
ncbi:caspase family protein [Streptomyces sp. NPDC001928]|uniref:caspase, EACC1-associated type n=1 Tax=Streptomyces sp. NPDC001928 TaxID=3154404 RepID=UPI00332D48E2